MNNMKKILIVVIAFMLTASLSAQVNWYRYVIDAHGGLKVGKTVEKTGATKTGSLVNTIDSIQVNTTAKSMTSYHGADTLNPYIPVAGQINISTVAVLKADSVVAGTTPAGSYATAQDLFQYSNNLHSLQLLGSSYKAMTLGAAPVGNHTVSTMGDGQLRLIAVYIPEKVTITGVVFAIGRQGDYTADNNNKVGLYKETAGNISLVASCANDGNLYKASVNTLVTKAFSSTYAATPGIYYVALLYNESADATIPQVFADNYTAGPFSTLDFTNSNRFCATLSAQTDLPAGPTALSSTTAGAAVTIVFLY